eukprot:TRINITY_DN3332_c0_g1_i1.p1 TRINITY_DN3332_c0_g1~~TRINITY_DN3332_c0_g1_i1.p1  ORF type:complete len:465 (+),score=208.76 TRINITY_DN3332_c0_g1_i1:100-1494(+)
MKNNPISPNGSRVRSPSLSDRITLFQQQQKQENNLVSPNQPLKRKLNYNAVRPLPSQSREDIDVKNDGKEVNLEEQNVRKEMEEEFKKREDQLKSQMRQVLIRVNEERTHLHEVCNKYKNANNEYATRIIRLEHMLKMTSNPNTPSASPPLSVVSPPPSPLEVHKNGGNSGSGTNNNGNNNDGNASLRSRSSSLSDSQKQKEIDELVRKLKIAEDSIKSEKSKNEGLTKQIEELKSSKSNNTTEKSQNSEETKVLHERTLATALTEIQRIMSERDAEMMRILRRELVPLTSSSLRVDSKDSPRNLVQKSKSLGGDELANLHKEKQESSRNLNSVSKLTRNSRVRKDRPTLLALYDYFPSSNEDLQFSEGDLLILHDKGPNGWWLAEMNGKVGKIPCNYICDLETSERVLMEAKSDFTPETESDLSMKMGERFFILNQDDDWWVGETSTGAIGYLPRNYLIPVEE